MLLAFVIFSQPRLQDTQVKVDLRPIRVQGIKPFQIPGGPGGTGLDRRGPGRPDSGSGREPAFDGKDVSEGKLAGVTHDRAAGNLVNGKAGCEMMSRSQSWSW